MEEGDRESIGTQMTGAKIGLTAISWIFENGHILTASSKKPPGN